MDYFFSEILKDFVFSLQLKGKSERTIETYCRHVNLFLRSVQTLPRQVSETTIRNYVRELFDTGRAVNSIKLKIISIKIFYRYLYEKGLIFSDPAADINEPENERCLPKSVLSPSSMEAIRNLFTGNSLLNLRDHAIVEVLYSTGLRLSELTALDISDIDLKSRYLQIRKGKGGRDRNAILDRDAVRAVSMYLDKRRKKPNNSTALWINSRGKRLSGRWIQKMLKKAAENAGLNTSANPHAWRHGVATALLRKGASIRVVQIFLGHSMLKTTQIYTHLTSMDLKKVHRRTHPREMDPIPQKINPTFSLSCS